MSTSEHNKSGRPLSDIWEHMIQGDKQSRGHYSATCNFCQQFWKQGKPHVLREHLANHCKKCSNDVSSYYAKVVGKKLQLHENAVALLQTIPWRGSIPGGTPTDPTVYRFYEVLQVYGSTLKALINEKFGDGIMSGINFRLGIDKVEDPEGGWRVVITLNGKFFPIKPY